MDAESHCTAHKAELMSEVVAINVAWPLGLRRFVAGLVTRQPVDALQGVAFFLVVVLYALVRIINSVKSTRSLKVALRTWRNAQSYS